MSFFILFLTISLSVNVFFLHFSLSFFHFYWYGQDRAQVLLLVWPPQWHGHTDTVIGMAGGHTGPMQRYAAA
jgi:hypothetical protein